MREVYKIFFLMISLSIFLFIMIYNSAKADDYKWIIIQSYQTQDNKVIMNHFPNSKIFSSRKECESELVLTELSKNTPHRKAISRGNEIFVVEYWSNGSIHTSVSCELMNKILY